MVSLASTSLEMSVGVTPRVPDSNVYCGFAGFGEKTNSLIRENNSLFVGEISLFRFLGNSLLTC